MATKAQLKTYFETGDKPLSSEFDELIDSCYGTDQQIFFDGTNVRLTRSDGGPDFLANISSLNKQSLTYSETNRSLTLSGNPAGNPVGPIMGLWNRAGSPAYPFPDDIYFLNDVGIGAAPSNGYKLAAYGNTWLNGNVRIGYGHTVNDITGDNTLHGAGASNSRLATEKAIYEFVNNNVDKNYFKGDMTSQYIAVTNGTTSTIGFTDAGNSGYNVGGHWQFNQFTAPEAGWYQLDLKMFVDCTISRFELENNPSWLTNLATVDAVFKIFNNPGGDSDVCAFYNAGTVQDNFFDTSTIVKLDQGARVRLEIFISNFNIPNETVRFQPSVNGRKCSSLAIKKLAV